MGPRLAHPHKRCPSSETFRNFLLATGAEFRAAKLHTRTAGSRRFQATRISDSLGSPCRLEDDYAVLVFSLGRCDERIGLRGAAATGAL